MLKGKKTYITGIVGVVTAVGAYLTGDATLMETVQLVFTMVAAVFIRKGVKSDTGN